MNKLSQSMPMVGIGPQRPFRFCNHRVGYQRIDPSWGSRQITADPVLAFNYTEWHNPGSTIPPHGHDFFEIAIIRGGVALVTGDVVEESLSRGDVILVPPGACQGYAGALEFFYTDLYLYPEWLLNNLQSLWHTEGLVQAMLKELLMRPQQDPVYLKFRLTEQELHRVEGEIADMASASPGSGASIVLYDGCFLKALAFMDSAFQREFPISTACDRLVWEALRRIETMIQESEFHGVESLARALDVSTTQLQREFRQAVGTSVHRYYLNRKLALAARELAEGSDLIADIAIRYGFNDPSHFLRAFRQRYGIAPGEYRRARSKPA